MKKILHEISYIIIVIAIGVVIGFVFKDKFTPIYDKFKSGDISTIIASPEKNVDESSITDQIKYISELSVLEYDYKNAYHYNASKSASIFGHKVDIPGTSKEILLLYKGTMKIGIDASKLTIDVEKNSDGSIKTITIGIPDTEIFSDTIDRDSYDTVVAEDGLFVDIDESDYDTIENDLTNQIEEQVLESETMSIAKSNAEQGIQNFLESMYGSDLNIVFVDAQ